MPAATHTFPSGASLGLRGDVPAYTPPDRAAWAQRTGRTPHLLGIIPTDEARIGDEFLVPLITDPARSEWIRIEVSAQVTGVIHNQYPVRRLHPKFVTRAKGAIARDWNTLSFEQAIVAHEQLDAIGLRLAAEFDLPESSTVFFDSTDDSFWVYPSES